MDVIVINAAPLPAAAPCERLDGPDRIYEAACAAEPSSNLGWNFSVGNDSPTTLLSHEQMDLTAQIKNEAALIRRVAKAYEQLGKVSAQAVEYFMLIRLTTKA